VKHLAAHPGVLQIGPEALQGIEKRSRPSVRAIDFVNRFADDPADSLFTTPPNQSLMPAEIARCNTDRIFHFQPAKSRF
jgi:hypothetical protein